jgi:hypothetical protein
MHAPVPSTQLLETFAATDHVELQTAVKLPPDGVYAGRHASVQPLPFVVKVELQLEVVICPWGMGGRPRQADVNIYKAMLSKWPNTPWAGSPELSTSTICTLMLVVPAGITA